MKNVILILFSTSILFSGCNKKEKKPNYIILLTDDQSIATLGSYDVNCPIQTPNLDKLASDGIRFTNGFVTTPICIVSRACLLTGQYVTNNRLHQFITPLEDEVFEHIYPQYLKQADYYLGQLGKYGIGVTQGQKQLFDKYDASDDQGPAFREYKGKTLHDAEWLTVRANDFLDSVPAGKPFCLQLNYKEPHPSSLPAPEDDNILDNYNFSRKTLDNEEAELNLPEFVRTGYGVSYYFKEKFDTEDGMNEHMRQYYEKIISVDRSIGKIRKSLEERGLADNTIIIFLSDHGTHHGERHLLGKWTPYDESLRIPFIILDPRKRATKGAVNEDMVLNIDIAPTLLDMAGIQIPEQMDGKSMKGLIYGSNDDWRDHFFFEHYCSPGMVPFYIPRSVGVRFKDTKYLRWIEVETDPDNTIEEYYDLSNDPLEAENLIQDPKYKQQVNSAREIFNRWREENPSSYRFDEYGPRAQFGSRNIDWEKFKAVKPKVYKKIEDEINRLGTDWNTAVYNWEVRFEICSNITYWY